VLKWAQQAITMLGSLWQKEFDHWKSEARDREPVYILVVKNTKLAKVLSERVALKTTFPRVEGYTQAIRNHIAFDWENVPPLKIDPLHIPTEIEMHGLSMTDRGRLTMSGPGRTSQADLEEFRKRHRTQQLVFVCAQRLTREYCAQPEATIAPHTLSPQLVPVVERYLRERVEVMHGGNLKDAFLLPYTHPNHPRAEQAAREARILSADDDTGAVVEAANWSGSSTSLSLSTLCSHR